MEVQPAPIGDPPSYSEVAGKEPFVVPCDDGGDGGQMNAKVKRPQCGWADPTSHQCPPAEPSQYPPPPPPAAGPTPYPPTYGQPMLAYYHQSAYGTPCYSVDPSQLQHQQVMMIGGQQPQPVLVEHVQSFAGHIVLSCIVIFCCNCILGFIAFVLASKRPLTFQTAAEITFIIIIISGMCNTSIQQVYKNLLTLLRPKGRTTW